MDGRQTVKKEQTNKFSRRIKNVWLYMDNSMNGMYNQV